MEPIVKGILTWSQLLKESFHGPSYLMNAFNMPVRAEVDVEIDSVVTRSPTHSAIQQPCT